MGLLRPLALVFALFLAEATGLRDAAAAGTPITQASEEQKKQAQTLFTRALEKSKKGDHEGALSDLRASFDVVASPNTKLKIARELADMGRAADAYREAVQAQKLASEAARADNTKYAEAERSARDEAEQYRAKVGFVMVDQGPLSGDLVVAGRSISKAEAREPILVDPGEITIELRGVGSIKTVKVTIAAGETKTAKLVADAPPPPPPKKEEPMTPWDLGDGERITGITLAGVGGVGFVLFVALGISNVSLHNDVEKQCPNHVCPDTVRDDVDKGRSLQLGANISLGIGAFGLAAGAAFLIPTFVIDKRDTSSAAIRVRPGFASLEGTF